MEFVKGNKEEFINFLRSITKKDKIAIITHTDLDGIGSAIFLEEILNSKNISVELLKFVDYKNDIIKKLLPIFKKEKISKIFILDLNIDSLALEDFENLRKEIPTFLIDHHPIDPRFKDFRNTIKAYSHNCVTQILHELKNQISNSKEKDWLLIPTMISEFSYKNLENLEFMKFAHPDITEKEILNSDQGKLCMVLNYAIIYYNDSLRKVYDLIKNKELTQLEKTYKIIDKEITQERKNILEKSEYSEEKNIYFYFFKPKHRIKSMISTDLSLQYPNSTFVLVTQEGKDKTFLSVSARNQSMNKDMNQLLKKAVQGLENANAGGHIPAAGGRFMKKDLNKFKENLFS